MAASDLMSKVNRAAKDPKYTSALRHLARQIDRRNTAALKKGAMLKGRSILRIIAVRVTTREHRGPACTCQDLMAIEIRGEGKNADADSFHFYSMMNGRG